MLKKIDLNCDMGESFGAYQVGQDEEVIKLISSANIACGYHGGDPDVMDRTVQLAKKYKVNVGAHPGYPDLLGFGRWNMDIPKETLINMIIYQIGALDIFCKKHNIKMSHVKPHGSLNNQADYDKSIAEAIVEAVQIIDPSLPLFVKPNSELERLAKRKGQPVVLEVFADRAYNKDMTLLSRAEAGSLITDVDDVVNNVLAIVNENKIIAVTGEEIPIRSESVCVHGDTFSAVKLIQALNDAFEKNGIKVASPSQFR